MWNMFMFMYIHMYIHTDRDVGLVRHPCSCHMQVTSLITACFCLAADLEDL